MNTELQALLQPYTFNNGVTVKNRLAVAPMTHFSSDENGHCTTEELDYIKPRSKGFGLFITASTAVNWNGRAFMGEPVAIAEQDLDSLRKVAETIKSQGAKAIIQLHHGGNQATLETTKGAEVVSPSSSEKAREMSQSEIEETIKNFGYSTSLAIQAGFDGVEIHGANNYLLQQFFSRKHNRRNDQWGGSLENRLRFPVAVLKEVLNSVKQHNKPDFIVGYRITPEESGELGLTMSDTLTLVDKLAELNLQYIHISLQDFYNKARRGADTKQSRLALIQKRLQDKNIALIGVGKLYTPKKAAKAFATGWVDFTAIGVGALVNPNFAELIEQGKAHQAKGMFNLSRDAKYHQMPEAMWNMIMSFIPKPLKIIGEMWKHIRGLFS